MTRAVKNTDMYSSLTQSHTAGQTNDPFQKKVLIVEDDSTHMAFIEKILTSTGLDTVKAENGLAALSQLDAEQLFDLILMDCDMPVMDGLDAVRAIRERQKQENHPHIPVIGFTANTRPGDREKCLEAGMDAYLPKDAWMGRWRQNLLDNLQGLFAGDVHIDDFQESVDMLEGSLNDDRTTSNIDAVDINALREAQLILGETFQIAIEEYLEDAAAYIRDSKEGCDHKDWNKIERGTHPLKSNSKSFGLMGLAEAAQSLHDLARQNNKNEDAFAHAHQLLDWLQQAFKRGEKHLRSYARNQRSDV